MLNGSFEQILVLSQICSSAA